VAFKIRSSTLAAEDSPQVSSIKLNTAPLDFFTLKLKRGALLHLKLSTAWMLWRRPHGWVYAVFQMEQGPSYIRN